MSLVRHLGIGLLATGVLLVGQIALEHTRVGARLEAYTYETLQSVLPDLTDESLPIVVIDTTHISGGKDGPTPRGELEKLLAAIVAQHPRAVAFDIDFSPNGQGWITPGDPAFFDYCLELKRRSLTPIYLGVYRAALEGPDTWLGLPKYQELAAAGIVDRTDVTRLPRFIRPKDGSSELPTIGAALAKAYSAEPPTPPRWISWALERTDRESIDDWIGGTVLVNYSKLKQLMHEHIELSARDPEKQIGGNLGGRLVLLGDVATPMDPFVLPGWTVPVPGVYLMASVAYSIAVEPMSEFSPLVRLALDFGISLAIILRVYRIDEQIKSPAARRKRLSRFLWRTVAVVIVAGLLLVRYAAIMWFDFILVLVAILLHPRVEDWIRKKLPLRREARHGSKA